MKFFKKIYLSAFILLSLINASNASDKDLFTLEKMPKSVLSHMVGFLTVKDVLKLSYTNKNFHKLICGDKENESKICIYQKTTPNNLLDVKYGAFISIKETDTGKHALKYFIGTLKNCEAKIFENISFEEILNSKNLHTIEFNWFCGVNLSKKNLGISDRILSLIKLNPKTLVLSLCENDISANKYFSSFNFSSNLKWLDLTNNDLGRMGKKFLSLKFPHTLNHLFLKNTNLGALGTNFALIEWPSSLMEVDLYGNSLKHFLKGARWPTSLSCLYLRNDSFATMKEEELNLLLETWKKSIERIKFT